MKQMHYTIAARRVLLALVPALLCSGCDGRKEETAAVCETDIKNYACAYTEKSTYRCDACGQAWVCGEFWWKTNISCECITESAGRDTACRSGGDTAS